ncbi:non-specific serine/threonine protein kinase [Ranunculus cassubicifolius]
MNSKDCFLSQAIFITLLIRVSFVENLGNETDRAALLAFKDHMSQNPAEDVLSSWNISTHFCKWEGVACGVRHQRVTKLNLTSCGLVGSVSPYIGNLSFLRVIDLRKNSLHGEIPQEIGRLYRLHTLLMENNSFSGNIPVNLSHCSNMVDLRLDYNNLSGKIPPQFGYFSKLASLGLYNNYLVGEIPSSIGNISSMEGLALAYNNLTGSIPDSLGQLKQLSFFTISSNTISGVVPPSLYNLSFLEDISLSANQLRGSLPHDMGQNLPNLRALRIGGNFFSGPIPISLFTNSSGLQFFDAVANNFTGAIPIQVGNLRDLQSLRLQGNNLGSGGKVDDLNFVNSLTNCSNLQVLSVGVNNLGGQLPNSVANLSVNLNKLYLYQNDISGTIPSDIGKLVNLIVFAVDSNSLTGPIPKSIGMLQNLQGMALSANRFSGHIPFSVGNMTSLFGLYIQDTNLGGTIVSSFANCKSLQKLYLDGNRLIGNIPAQLLGSLHQLDEIGLSRNSLSGLLPIEIGNLRNLRALDVSHNKISGEIPNTLGDCSVLESLNLSNNLFHGHVPSSFVYLKGIQSIDLSRNDLSGKITPDLGNLTFLENLNLSFNKFDGEVPVTGIFNNATSFSIVGNDNLCGGINALHLPKCRVPKTKKKGISLALKVSIGVLLPLTVLASVLVFVYWRRKPSSRPFSSRFGNSLLRVSYKELSDATNGFSPNNLIGAGSYGSVYKGCMREADNLIAVKVINLMKKGASKSFLTECEVLRKVRHRNLLKILTACSSVDSHCNDFKALVFEFMPKGSLENWLYPSFSESSSSRNLNFLQMLNIAIDTASALDYLHNQWQTPIIHCDLKPSNVLLDDEMVAHVADFGIAKFLENNVDNLTENEFSSITIRGSIGYVPPEYAMGAEVSTQGDVYSYGILLLEMLTRKRPNDAVFKDNLNLHKLCKSSSAEQVMEIINGGLFPRDFSNEASKTKVDQVKAVLVSLMEIGVTCSSESVSQRMTIAGVLLKMHKIKATFVGIENFDQV